MFEETLSEKVEKQEASDEESRGKTAAPSDLLFTATSLSRPSAPLADSIMQLFSFVGLFGNKSTMGSFKLTTAPVHK